jgi:hypothetical protein
MAKVGRPPKYTEPDINEMVRKFTEYIECKDMPIIAEFAYLNDIDRRYLYEKEEFSTLLKKAIAKKESYLEEKGLKGEVNPTMAIFSLKQLGWRDKQEFEHSGNMGVSIIDNIK